MPSLPLVAPQVPRLTCLLWCMMPKVGNTQVLAGGTMSLSAKLTHCTTWAAASGVLPRSSSLLTAESEHKGQNSGAMPTPMHTAENSSPCPLQLSLILSYTPHLQTLPFPHPLQITIVGNGIALKHTESIITLKCGNLGTKQSKVSKIHSNLSLVNPRSWTVLDKGFYRRMTIPASQTPPTTETQEPKIFSNLVPFTA